MIGTFGPDLPMVVSNLPLASERRPKLRGLRKNIFINWVARPCVPEERGTRETRLSSTQGRATLVRGL